MLRNVYFGEVLGPIVVRLVETSEAHEIKDTNDILHGNISLVSWKEARLSSYEYKQLLQWGDTVSLDCKAADLDLRLDHRVVLKSKQEDLEAMTGEAASRQSTTTKKLYADRMKSVIATKCHLNKLLTQMPFLPPRETKLLYMPIIQIMGLDCSIYAM